MPDEKSLNLEPVDEKDLDTRAKFAGEKKIEAGNIFIEKETGEEKVAENELTYGKILSRVKTSQTDDEIVKNDARQVAEKMDVETQVQHLVEIALQKGIVHAVKVAKHYDYYFLDKLHDLLLTDELQKALVAKGMIKEE